MSETSISSKPKRKNQKEGVLMPIFILPPFSHLSKGETWYGTYYNTCRLLGFALAEREKRRDRNKRA